MSKQKWYFGYDSDTLVYNGARLVMADEADNVIQPDNTTDIEPGAFVGTIVFDKQNNQWTGLTMSDWNRQQDGSANG